MPFYNRLRVACATTGNGTSLTLGAAWPGNFYTAAQAGVPDGGSFRYLIEDLGTGAIEVQTGTYAASGTTLTRGTPEASSNGGARIVLSGNAVVTHLPSAADFNAFATITDTRNWQTTANITGGTVNSTGAFYGGSSGSFAGALVSGGGQRSLRATTSGTGATANDYVTDSGNANLLGYWTYTNQQAAWSANLSAGGALIGNSITSNSYITLLNSGALTHSYSGAGTDQKNSRYYATAGGVVFDLINDAYSAATSWLTVQRSGYSPVNTFWGLNLLPGADNYFNLGNASYRWSNLYVANNPIVGSDARIKGVPRDFDDKFLDAWGRIRWRVFQYLDAIAKKGEEWARWNLGAIAQEVRDDLLAGGIDGTRYGILCYDKWDAIEHIEQPFVPGVPAFAGVPDLTDEFGNVLSWYVEPQPEVAPIPAGVIQQGREAGDLWSLRYTQMLVAEAAWSRREHGRASTRLDDLEGRLAQHERA